MNKNFKIIFVTGASRSGTTMLSKILGANTRVLGLKELHYFGGMVEISQLDRKAGIEDLIKYTSLIFSRNSKGLWGGEPSESEIEEATDLVKSFTSEETTYGELYSHAVSYLAEKGGRNIACEQTPRNIFYGKTLLDIYPTSKIIHIVRDPRAVLASQKSKWRTKKLGAHKMPVIEMIRVWINYHPITMSKLWMKATEAALGISPGDNIRIIKYEDLVESPEKVVGDLCDFVDIDFEKEMLNISSMASSYRKSGRAKKGISKAGLNRWKEALSNGEIVVCERLAKEYMSRYSYRRSATNKNYISILFQILSYPLHLLGVVISNPGRVWIQLKAISRTGA